MLERERRSGESWYNFPNDEVAPEHGCIRPVYDHGLRYWNENIILTNIYHLVTVKMTTSV